jgi:hypothetical protein
MVEEAKKYFQNKNNFDKSGKAFDWRKQANAMRVLNAYEIKEKFYKARSSVFSMGKLLFYTTPCELFTEYAKRINTSFSQNPVIDVQLTNDYIGYLPTIEAIKHGGYSTEISSRATTSVGGEVLIERVTEMLKELCNYIDIKEK